jgi:hypothetical protein
MWGNDKNLNICARLPIEDVVRKTRNPIAPDIGRKLDAIAMWTLADLGHCGVKGCEITRTESFLASLVIGYMLKVFNACRFIEELAHLSRA